MAPPQWELTSVKAQLRLTSQRLGHLQEKYDSKASISRRDIATLLQQGNVGLARVKAQNLYQEDMQGDVLEILEMHLGVILEHISELEHNSPSPAVIEAAASIVYASSRVDYRDLSAVREVLVNRLGSDFARASVGNRDRCVSDRIVKNLSAPPPTAAQLDAYLLNIAKAYGVVWAPEPRRQDILVPLSEILDPESAPIVDVATLRKLCARGIPDSPSWIRPRIWKVLLGTLPVSKSSWQKEVGGQRDSYYDLVRRFLEPFGELPDPTIPLSSLDVSLLKAAKQLSGIPPSLLTGLEQEPESSNLCPLDFSASENMKISCASNLDIRLQAIQKTQPDSSPSIPEIRLEPEVYDDTSESSAIDAAKVLSASRPLNDHAHEKHSSALLRLLFLHSKINPGNLSPHIPALLPPLYAVLNQEVEPEDVAHVEADTFWLFEAMVGEFSELEDEEGGNIWMKKFSERLTWADAELRDNLLAKGLDPALPHYSYRWLAPLLTQTLPLPSVLVVWDALFACRMREQQNFKLEFFIDICTAMLLRARTALLRLGKSNLKSPSLWSETEGPSSPLRAWELGDAFIQGNALLQHYPIDAAGGIDVVLQEASDLRSRREDEAKLAAANPVSLGDRLRLQIWKGFTNQPSSPERSPSPSEVEGDESSPDEGNETETVSGPGLGARLATTFWRGITNESAMEAPPSPITPHTPQSPSPSLPRTPLSPSIVITGETETDSGPGLGARLATTFWRGVTNESAMEAPPSPNTPHTPHTPQLLSPSLPPTPLSPSNVAAEPVASKSWASSAWGYAEKFKESNAAATLSKVSSNWQAKAMATSWNQPKVDQPASADSARYSDPVQNFGLKANEARRGSVPDMDRSGVYSPPARPAYFRPPRDTMIFSGNAPVVDVPSPEIISPSSESGIMQKARNLSLAALTRSDPTSSPTPVTPQKSAPRPLLLSSSNLITPRDRPISRSENSTPIDRRTMSGQWNDVMQSRKPAVRDSLSSVSSLSPSDALMRGEYDSDGPSSGSRKVALNRRSISPMAPHARMGSIPDSGGVPPVPHLRTGSLSTSSSSSGGAALTSPVVMSPMDVRHPRSPGWGQVQIPDSPPAGSPLRKESVTSIPEEKSSSAGSHTAVPLDLPSQPRKLARKKTPPPTLHPPGDTSDSSVPELPSRSARIRSKRNPNLRLQSSHTAPVAIPERNATSPSSLAVDWPHDELEVSLTPKAASFDLNLQSSSPKSPRRARKVSTEGRSPTRQRKASGDGVQEPRSRKISSESRTRKTSDSKAKRHRESAADMGDDEGYDDLLSAYESEDGHQSEALVSS